MKIYVELGKVVVGVVVIVVGTVMVAGSVDQVIRDVGLMMIVMGAVWLGYLYGKENRQD